MFHVLIQGDCWIFSNPNTCIIIYAFIQSVWDIDSNQHHNSLWKLNAISSVCQWLNTEFPFYSMVYLDVNVFDWITFVIYFGIPNLLPVMNNPWAVLISVEINRLRWTLDIKKDLSAACWNLAKVTHITCIIYLFDAGNYVNCVPGNTLERSPLLFLNALELRS